MVLGGRGGRYLGVGVYSAFGHICPVPSIPMNVLAYSHTSARPPPHLTGLRLQASSSVSVLMAVPLLQGALS